MSEGNTTTVNVVASTDFSTPFSVDISHNGSGGELGCVHTCSDHILAQLRKGRVTATDYLPPCKHLLSLYSFSTDLTLSTDVLSFSPSSRTASVILTATNDTIKEMDEFFMLSLAVTDPMSRECGVDLGERSTATVIVQDTTEGELGVIIIVGVRSFLGNNLYFPAFMFL